MLNKVFKYINDFRYHLEFGVMNALRLAICASRLNYPKRIKYVRKVKYYYLSHFFSSIKIEGHYENSINNEGPIWFCWWQGKENMPKIVDACWKSLKKHITQRTIVFIDSNNFMDYTSINSTILTKLNNGEISITHFSDILRFNLLYLHGGIWLDSTVLISESANSFFNNPFFTVSIPTNDSYISQGRWSGFLIGGRAGDSLFKFMVDAFNYYWEIHTKLIDYFLIDYLILIAYNRSDTIKKAINEFSYEFKDLYLLQRNLCNPMNKKFIPVIEKNPFNKLSWKVVCSSDDSLKEYIERHA